MNTGAFKNLECLASVCMPDTRALPFLQYPAGATIEVFVKSAANPDNIICHAASYKGQLPALQAQLMATMAGV